MLKNEETLKKFYMEELTGKYEGYIQMSDRRIEKVFTSPQSLPMWDTLHNGVNYILEMALFDPDDSRSILIRQHNADWLVINVVLNANEPLTSYYTVTSDTPKMKIAQIWEEEENVFCFNMNVWEPKYLLFAGFEEVQGGES